MSRYLAQMGYTRQALCQKARRAIPVLKLRFRQNVAYWMTNVDQIMVQDETRYAVCLAVINYFPSARKLMPNTLVLQCATANAICPVTAIL